MKKYDHRAVEKKWQATWNRLKLHRPPATSRKPKFYGLIEFPYPSGEGLHVGHIRSNTAMDVIARKRRMEGYDVLYPIGWDAFGLPTENFAIKTGIHPAIVTKRNTDNFRRQLKALGFSFDWSREINTSDPAYYRWTQWIFLRFFKKGLAYKKRMAVNWCPKDKIVLANEEVIDGRCERCGTQVEQREKEQWMLAITKYAERLEKDLDLVDFQERIKIQQRNWIGKSEGAQIDFPIKDDVKRVVLLHGRGGSPERNFFPWLKQKLESLGYEVQVPLLPNSKNPNDEEQLDYVLKNCTLDENTAIMGHSFGGVVALRLIEHGIKVKRVILAGTPFSGNFIDGKARPSVSVAVQKGFDFESIRARASFVAIYDRGDDVVPLSDGEALARHLGCPFVLADGVESHFCAPEEPAVIDTIVPKIKVFTTRPDTIFGATYLVLSPEHPWIQQLLPNIENANEVQKYIQEARNKTEIERTSDEREKTGVLLRNIFAINTATAREIPIWIADYVLKDYGTGAIMAVPAHDERDYQFAKKFDLPIIPVISHEESSGKPYAGSGILMNSGKFSGIHSDAAKQQITDFVQGKWVTTYRLRDWIFSRQRYWGEPIPLIHCVNCGWVAVPEKKLPVKLPAIKKYQPTDSGESPLAAAENWVKTKCPECGGAARRETDTMPNWAGSSWYFLRYVDPKNKKIFADKQKLKRWIPVDWYNGGMEHTTLHLLYSRFWHKFLYDQKLVPTTEPYARRTSHGLILASGGVKMSKSKGNVINPDDLMTRFGADALRLYEMFMGPFDQAITWSEDGVVGTRRFIERVWKLSDKVAKKFTDDRELETVMHQTIHKVTQDIESMKFNTAVSQLMIYANKLESAEAISLGAFEVLLKLLSPFAPHVCDEIYAAISKKKVLSTLPWPKADMGKMQALLRKIAVQVNGKVRGIVDAPDNSTQEEVVAAALRLPDVLKWIPDGQVKKAIYVRGRILNLLV